MHPFRRPAPPWALALLVLAPLCARAAGPEGAIYRVDVTGASAAPSVGVNRTLDGYTHVDFEAEVPLYRGLMLSGRAMPVFLYGEGAGRLLFGVGFGMGNRLYFSGAQRTGVYAEVGSAVLWTQGFFEGNASRLNLLSRVGLGYRLRGGRWHGALVFEHTSNALTAQPDRGINGVGLLLGVELG